ncbi:MAG: hypothetical protein KKC64_09565 [Spirochaetes bacterium]|nr:hypothetical protein [Spirochaetota bacterium]
MTKKTKVFWAKLISAVSALVVLFLVIYLSSGFTQSRFIFKRHDSAMIFFDKYVDRSLRNTILDGKTEHTKNFMNNAGLLPIEKADEPYAYFIADRTYGVLSANDPLTKRYMKDAESPDFVMLRSIGSNFFANELVSTSLASSDGRYVFLTTSANWQESLLHAWVHAQAARKLPEDLAKRMRPDGNWDYSTAASWRFVDETIALFASDLYNAASRSSLDMAWSKLAEFSQERYGSPESELRQREEILLSITFDYPQRSAAYYEAANDFGLFLADSLGREAFSRLSERFLCGEYNSLDDLFAQLGGFAAALTAWQGNPSLPE